MATVVMLSKGSTASKNCDLPSFVAEVSIMVDTHSSLTSTNNFNASRAEDKPNLPSNQSDGPIELNGQHERKEWDKDIPLRLESTKSIKDVLEADFDDPKKLPISQETTNLETFTSDEWFNGDTDLPRKDERDDGNLLFTAPISLYMSTDGSESLGSNVANGKLSNQSLDSAGRTHVSESLSTVGNEGQIGSLSSRGSISSNSIPRPLLYSAIGSLENPNPTSLGSLSKRLTTVYKTSTLIPPPSQAGTVEESKSSKADRNDSHGREMVHSVRSKQTLHPGPSHEVSRNITESQSGTKISIDERKQTHVPSEGGGGNSSEGLVRNKVQKISNLRRSNTRTRDNKKRVSYDRKSLQSKITVELFRPSCDAYTPRIEKKKIKYKAAEKRTPVQTMATTMGTLQRPNFRDALRRVAMIIHQHILKIERRFEGTDIRDGEKGLFRTSMRDAFAEENFSTPTYKCTMVRIPMARPGMVFGLREIKISPRIPSENEIYEFAHQLFQSVQLSSECSIVCLIYIERLMEVAKVPLLACTWRPIFMCGLLLASKVWQDLSSWNIEFASVYPQFSLDAINKLELNFLRNVKWDLYISSR
jgi:hypothetical protein